MQTNTPQPAENDPRNRSAPALSDPALNDRQIDAIESAHPRILCLAGPGSGKTHTLTHRILRLLEKGEDPACMVAITFTNAGARELSNRLPDGVRLGYIGTLHGFALRELQRHGQPLGFRDKITVLDEATSEAMLMSHGRALKRNITLRELKDAMATPKDEFSCASLAVSSYRGYLRMENAVDFDTLLLEFRSLLRMGSYLPMWEHLFVDEIQDSCAVDAEIYQLFPARNRFLVGDPDQAIYGFRGGSLDYVLYLAKNPRWETITMEGNYRCGGVICSAAGRLIARNQRRVPKRTISHTGEFGTIQIASPATEEIERVLLAENIRQDIEKGMDPAEIAVLARTNSITNAAGQALAAAGVPVHRKIERRFPDDWALARAAVNILYTPDSRLAVSRYLWLQCPGRADEIIQAADLAQIPLILQVPGFVDIAGNLNRVPAELMTLGVGRESVALIVDRIKALPNQDIGSLVVDLAQDPFHQDEVGDGVTCTTIHSAKGREFEVVYLIGAEQEIIPGRSRRRDIEEERRLFYVAMTRARTGLVVSHCAARRDDFGLQSFARATPSQFLQEFSHD